jgi:quinol-cytochrome oxidoreductase complex cytochrome b subunit
MKDGEDYLTKDYKKVVKKGYILGAIVAFILVLFFVYGYIDHISGKKFTELPMHSRIMLIIFVVAMFASGRVLQKYMINNYEILSSKTKRKR